MSRGITTALDNALSDPAVLYPVYLAKLGFDSGTVFLHSGLGDITYDGDTYTGVGTLGDVSTIEENSDTSANGVDLSLSGISNSILSIALDEDIQGRPCTIYFGVFDTTSYTLIADPFEIYRGFMDVMNGNYGNDANIGLRVESEAIQWSRQRTLRYNDETQKSFFPDDTGFEFIGQAVAKPVIWGQ
jgi:hypothetical protein